MNPWKVWIDTGGTFTDCLARDPDGQLHRAKVLSTAALRGTVLEMVGTGKVRLRAGWTVAAGGLTGCRFRILGSAHPDVRVKRYDPESGVLELMDAPEVEPAPGSTFEISSHEEAPVLAARVVTGTPVGHPFPPLEMRLATTRGTNALLERGGARVALFVTRGFGDLLRIGTQQRPNLFALDIRRPEPLYEEAIEVPERLAADGEVLEPLDADSLAPVAARLVEGGVRVAAVALLHSYRNPRHELALRGMLLSAGFLHVSCSAAAAPAIKILPRAETAVVDAYLSPVIEEYLERVSSAIEGGVLHVMTSAGGLVRPADFRPCNSLLSGPAGGVVGGALAGRQEGFARVIAFDMGGTSTDVARTDGDYEYVWEHQVGGVRLVAPALAIHSVAAGGGSVCSADVEGVRVGPESAGARPGPACYGAGGPLTLTDANLLLGRLDSSRFGIPVHRGLAKQAVEQMRADVRRLRGEDAPTEKLLQGFLNIANERMADAIREISVRKGYDPAEYALVAFGGAGGQHACAIAALLGMDTVLVPADAGLLSAHGLGHAVLERFAQRQVLLPLDEAGPQIEVWLSELETRAAEAVEREDVSPEDIVVRRRIADLRYIGQESTIEVDFQPDAPLDALFEDRYAATYGHRPQARPIELVSLRVIASTRAVPPEPISSPVTYRAEPAGSKTAWVGGQWSEVPAYDRGSLEPGASLRGPALVWEAHSATLIEPGWKGSVGGSGALILERLKDLEETRTAHDEQAPAAVLEELFTRRFEAIVGEMGEMLQRTALSTNVKERLDFSCAMLNPRGDLVVNAPHIPVHLGAIGECVRRVCKDLMLAPDDVAITNHPAFGGSHLPDVTVITPVHNPSGILLGYVANRAHHAEIGGKRPGSMPPDATTLAEEGVVIPPMHIVRNGAPQWDAVRRLLADSPFPSRAVEENLTDMAAQVAANHRGKALLQGLASAHDANVLHHYMQALTNRAGRRVSAALKRLGDGTFAATERLDDGTPISAKIIINGGSAAVDFSGTGAVHPGNLNATPAVVRSVVLYVLRLLVDEPLPLNEGLLRKVDIHLPEGILNPPFPADPRAAPAVVGGNVETSQRLVDTIIKALGLAACSQGTMNNVLFGNDVFGYYETVCGGAGAGPGWAGAGVVHTHMTNTRITDAEIIEHRYPVRIERFAVRKGSGGRGEWCGGDGAVRQILFLSPMSLSVLTQHRVERPYGMQGGAPGKPGSQKIIRSDGSTLQLDAIDGCDVRVGDRLVLETPGGGGWGRAGGGR